MTKKNNHHTRSLAKSSTEAGPNEANSAHPILEANQEADIDIAALETIPDDDRRIVLLRYRHERSIKELAQIFYLSESVGKTLLHRSLEELRSKLMKTDHG